MIQPKIESPFKKIESLNLKRLKSNAKNFIAFGTESKGSVCIINGDCVLLSPSVGNLTNIENLKLFEESSNYALEELLKIDYIISDLHPDYASSGIAEEIHLKMPNAKFIKVQHHHSHMTASLAENNITKEVIGVIFDGSGLGVDNKSWGGEFFVGDLTGFTRIYHFEEIALAGMDRAGLEAYRNALAYLYKAYGEKLLDCKFEIVKRIGLDRVSLLIEAIKRNINTTQTTSCGRLFDAISSLIGLCDINKFEAEAAIRLEEVADKKIKESYPFTIIEENISFLDMIKAIVSDMSVDTPAGVISAKFHNTLVQVILDVSKRLRSQYKINTVSLSGGVFQNKFLLSMAISALRDAEFDVCVNKNIPLTDAGIAFGQAMIALYNDE